VLAGEGEVLHSYIYPTSTLYDETYINQWPYDPAAGQARLQNAGWVLEQDGWRYKDGQKFAITYMTGLGSGYRFQIAHMLQADLAACGIDMTIDFRPPSELYADGPEGPVFWQKI
jgi:peptide/nickel transport system substrate-binding protein